MTQTPVTEAVRALPQTDHLVLAVSGGLDSMVLLDAVAGLHPKARLTVATFDHGTGAAATQAARTVAGAATARGIDVVVGGGTRLPPTEAAWRDARWRFLRHVAAARGARVVTAHTEDDQAETVLMRAMRDAGPRGLAGLLAASEVLRPFLTLRRTALESYATRWSLAWVDDPSNADRRYSRNRVRHDLLPTLERVRPGFRAELLAVGRRAAAWRAEMDRVADACCPSRRTASGGVIVAASDLLGYDAASLAVLWPAIAARAGLPLDHRGTRRLAEFTRGSTPGTVAPLSGGWEVVRGTSEFELRRVRPVVPAASPLPRPGVLRWGRWCFVVGEAPEARDPWSVVVPDGQPLMVRSWEPADRMRVGAGLVRVKRLLAEGGVSPADRPGWPVVVAGDAIVWIPGVSRAPAATARSGRPGVSIRCEPSDG